MVSQVSAPYVRIRQHVIRLVANANGERLKIMSEKQFCELFGVCRSTVRKALKELVDEGELVSEDGVGMFVVPRPVGVPAGCNPGIKRRMLGVIVGNGLRVHFDYPVARMQRGILSVLEETPHFFQFFSLVNKEPERILKELAALRLDGLLWLQPFKGYEGLVAQLALPLVVVSSESFAARRLVVCGDPLDKAETVAEHFFSLNLRCFAVLGSPANQSCCAQFYDGLRAAFLRRGASFDEKLLLTGDDRLGQLEAMLKFRVGVEGVYASAACYVEPMLKIVDRLTPGLPALVDESPLNVYGAALPARVRTPFDEAGRRAAEMLLDILDGRLDGQASIAIPNIVIPQSKEGSHP